jgi:hypothetical protein
MHAHITLLWRHLRGRIVAVSPVSARLICLSSFLEVIVATLVKNKHLFVIYNMLHRFVSRVLEEVRVLES